VANRNRAIGGGNSCVEAGVAMKHPPARIYIRAYLAQLLTHGKVTPRKFARWQAFVGPDL